METFKIEVESPGGAAHTVLACVIVDEEAVSYFRGWLMSDDTLNVGEIFTVEEHRRRGLAARLVLYASEVLRVSTIQASINSREGEKLFASLRRDATSFTVDYGY